MKGFRSPAGAQQFLSVFSAISPRFRPRRHRLTAPQYRGQMTGRFTTWNEIIGLPAAADRGTGTGAGQALAHPHTARLQTS